MKTFIKATIISFLLCLTISQNASLNSVMLTTKDGKTVSKFSMIRGDSSTIQATKTRQLISIRNQIQGFNFRITTQNGKNVSHQLIGYNPYVLGEYKGFKHFQKGQQIKKFMQDLLKQNEISFIKIRLEDAFTIMAYKESQSNPESWRIYMINVEYLHPTIVLQQLKRKFNDQIFIANQDAQKNQMILVSNGGKQTKQQIPLSGTFKRKLSGSGLHQKLNYTINPSPMIDITPQCTLVIEDILPESMYIDVDELYSIVAYQTIDIEKPAHFAKQYYYKYSKSFAEINITRSNQYFFQQPIHFRYPAPKQKQQYTFVKVEATEGAWIECGDQKYLLQQDFLADRGIAKIPNGSIEQSQFVSLATFVGTIVCALLLSKQLRTK